MITKSETIEAVRKYLSGLALTEETDFLVADGPGKNICVRMNTGHLISSYEKGIKTQVLEKTEFTLQIKNEQLYVREKPQKQAAGGNRR